MMDKIYSGVANDRVLTEELYTHAFFCMYLRISYISTSPHSSE